MRRTLLSVSLGAAMLLSAGCANVLTMAANLGAQTMIGKSAADRKADRCYALTKKMEAEKLGSAEMVRERTKANC